MKKNVASQVIGAQMVSATDGSAFTGSVTVHVTGDGGTQATGSVGSGACTHEGNGFHTYAPAQAETNYDHVAFTFTGTGAVPATVQCYTTFPQTGDNFVRLGAPAGASVSVDIAAIKSQTAAIETDTQDIQSRIPAALVSGRIDASVGAMAANTLTASALATDAVTEIQSGLATSSALATTDGKVDDILTDTGTTLPSTLATIAGYIDTEIGTIITNQATAQADLDIITGADGVVISTAGLAAINAEADTALADYDGPTHAELVSEINAVQSDIAGVQTSVNDLPTNAELATALAAADDAVLTQVALVKAKTDNLTFTVAGNADVNIQYVNDVQVTGDGQSGSEWGPA